MVTYHEIKGKILHEEKFVIVLLNKAAMASSYLLELTLSDILKEFPQKINVYKIGEQEHKIIFDDLQLFAEPSLLIFVDGKLSDVVYFPVSKKNLQERLSSIFHEQNQTLKENNN